jgi:GTP cyclohydrolase I
MKFNNIINLLNSELKLKQQENWDNSGLQIGNLNADIKNVMILLDLDKEIIDTAIKNKIDLIITHHPFFFNEIKSIDFGTYDGEVIKYLIENNINLYSMHTSLDMAEYGVNYALAEKLSIKNYDILHNINDDKEYGYGGIADINEINILEYTNSVKFALGCNSVKLFCTDTSKKISRVAFCGGSGSEFIEDAINNKADIYITGDIKYHQAQEAMKYGLSIIDAGHYYTEYHIIYSIEKALVNVADLKIITLNKNTVDEIVI